MNMNNVSYNIYMCAKEGGKDTSNKRKTNIFTSIQNVVQKLQPKQNFISIVSHMCSHFYKLGEKKATFDIICQFKSSLSIQLICRLLLCLQQPQPYISISTWNTHTHKSLLSIWTPCTYSALFNVSRWLLFFSLFILFRLQLIPSVFLLHTLSCLRLFILVFFLVVFICITDQHIIVQVSRWDYTRWMECKWVWLVCRVCVCVRSVYHKYVYVHKRFDRDIIWSVKTGHFWYGLQEIHFSHSFLVSMFGVL